MDSNGQELVRARVRADHARLRTLLNTVLVGACVARHEPRLVRRVRAGLDQVQDELLAHLEFEEQALVGLLQDADAWGPVRADELLEVHATERTMVAAVVEDFDAGDRPFEDLEEELVWLAIAIERDMAEQERRFLTEEALGDSSPVSIQQTDG